MTLSDTKDLFRQLQVDVMEIVGDEFAPKQESGSPERKRLLGLLGKITPLFLEAEKAILTEVAHHERRAAKKELELLEQIDFSEPDNDELEPMDLETYIQHRLAELERDG